MTISYEAAMATLLTMFPTADQAVITMVLENNGGHMERTVENLLSMNLPQEDGGAGAGSVPMQGSAKRDYQPRDYASQGLPDDFLRPPSYFQKTASVDQGQLEQDMLLAQMLQDEEFLRDLRRNPTAYGMERRGRRGRPKPPSEPKPDKAGGADAAAADAADDEKSAPRSKFSQLGDAAKRKLQNLVSKFSRTTKISTDQRAYMSLPSLDDEDGMGMGGYADDDMGPAIELQDRRFTKKDSAADDDEKD